MPVYNGTVQNDYATGAASGRNCVGGFAGNGDFSNISSVFATGTATGSMQVGGLVGCEGNTPVSASFATGDAVGSSKVGAIEGESWNATISNTYWFGDLGGSGCNCKTAARRRSEDRLDGFLIGLLGLVTTLRARRRRNFQDTTKHP